MVVYKTLENFSIQFNLQKFCLQNDNIQGEAYKVLRTNISEKMQYLNIFQTKVVKF